MSTFTEAEPADHDNRHAGQLKRLTASRRRRQDSASEEGDDLNDDELFDELERELEEQEGRADGVMGRLREERMNALRAEIQQQEARRNAPRGAGRLTEPTNEKELMQILGDRAGDLSGDGMPVIVHFYHKEFRRCDIMNEHLEIIAAQHPEALFVRMSVLAAPFLVEKLQVKVLPCLVTFGKRAQVKDQIVGFEDLGNSDGFTTRTLEWRLAQKGALHASQTDQQSDRPIFGFATSLASAADDDNDLDWD